MAGAQAGESEAGVFIPDQEGRVKMRKAEWMDSLVLREQATGVPDTWVLGKVELVWTPTPKGRGAGNLNSRIQGERKSLLPHAACPPASPPPFLVMLLSNS